MKGFLTAEVRMRIKENAEHAFFEENAYL